MLKIQDGDGIMLFSRNVSGVRFRVHYFQRWKRSEDGSNYKQVFVVEGSPHCCLGF
jgi:hypothetical protein